MDQIITCELWKLQFWDWQRNANKIELLKAKLHGFTHPHTETEAVYKTSADEDL